MTVDNPKLSLLGLFPGMESGGVQISGQLAWDTVLDSSRATGARPFLLCYGKAALRVPDTPNGTGVVHVASRLAALRAALTMKRAFQAVLVWHLDLLRLLPFFRTRGARVALFLHGIESWRRQGLLRQALLGRVQLFLSNSEHTWKRFLSSNPRFETVRHRVVPLGLGAPLKAAVPLPSHPPAVLMLSRLLRSEDYKGHREVLSAWPLVLERLPEAELWVAGEGDLREDLMQAVRVRGLAERVRFFGAVSEAGKEELLARCRCLAMPSRGEGFGLVYLEAMRMGRPCLVSNDDAGREVVNPPQAGLAVNLGDPQLLSRAIVELLTPGARWESWSAQARLRYETQFTAEHFRQRLLSAFSPPAEWGLA